VRTAIGPRRFTKLQPCPVCGGSAYLSRGRGVRCYGFLGHDGRYAHCTNDAFAGSLEMETSNTFAHRLDVLDLAGRRVAHRDLLGLEPGRHVVRLGLALPPGVYMISLSQAGERRAARAVVRP